MKISSNMIKATFVLVLVAVSMMAVAQEPNTKVFDVVEQMPSFKGGDATLREWLSMNIKYPKVAEENGIQGRVICSFFVERDGSISNVQVVKSVDPALDKEACRVLRSMPRWNPGKQGGEEVRVKYTVPVTFQLSPQTHEKADGKKVRGGLEDLYEKDNKPYKDMHLYVAANGNNVSGINKSISELSPDELLTISKKSKKTADDILKWSEESKGGNVVYDLTVENTINNGIVRPRFKTENGLDEYMKSHLSTSFEKIYVMVSFIVETDGSISCPIVEKGNDLKAIKAVVRQLRKTKKWQPAVKDGVPVRARINHTFSYNNT